MANSPKPQIEEIVSRESLSPEELKDLESAAAARLNGYAPYTGFHVGAAIRSNNGEVVTGHNFETIVHAGVHAETAALGQTTVEGRIAGIKTVTVVGGPESQPDFSEPVLCCGACRQMLLEIIGESDDPLIIAAGIKGDVLKVKLKDLVPLPFYPGSIAKKYPQG